MEDVRELRGGMGNRGRVVRVGNTVRRPAGADSAVVTSLLAHLAADGFAGAPIPLGRDSDA